MPLRSQIHLQGTSYSIRAEVNLIEKERDLSQRGGCCILSSANKLMLQNKSWDLKSQLIFIKLLKLNISIVHKNTWGLAAFMVQRRIRFQCCHSSQVGGYARWEQAEVQLRANPFLQMSQIQGVVMWLPHRWPLECRHRGRAGKHNTTAMARRFIWKSTVKERMWCVSQIYGTARWWSGSMCSSICL